VRGDGLENHTAATSKNDWATTVLVTMSQPAVGVFIIRPMRPGRRMRGFPHGGLRVPHETRRVEGTDAPPRHLYTSGYGGGVGSPPPLGPEGVMANHTPWMPCPFASPGL